jgi:hypothetical protein
MVEQLLSEDETRAAFANLRAETLPRVHVPGAGAVRRTVRRRHRAVTVAAGVAVAAVAGGVVTTIADRPSSTALAPPTAPSPEPVGPSLVLPPGARTGLYASPPAGSDESFDLTLRDHRPGPRRFVILCSGAGAGQATLTAGDVQTTAQVNCGVPPMSREIDIDVPPSADELRLRIAWDPGHRLIDTEQGWAVVVQGLD